MYAAVSTPVPIAISLSAMPVQMVSRLLTSAPAPEAFSVVTVHYTGWTTDGKMFDSSVKRDKTSTFRLDRVIKGWTEGLQLMVVGEKRRFWIPQELAYGKNGRVPGMLVFDVELYRFQ